MTEACILVRTGHECGQVRESRGAAVSMNFLIEHLHKKNSVRACVHQPPANI